MAEPRKPDIKKSILNRVRMLYILFFAVGVAIAGKILYIQYGPGGESLRSKGERISYERVAIEADRGDVLAWDGRLLATSVPMYEVRMDFAAQGLADSVFRKYADSLAGALATFFGDKSKNAYLILLNRAYSNKSKNRFTQIAPRRVNHLEIKQISQFPILRLGQNRGGFIPVQINKRLLPNGPMASRTIGRVKEAGRKWGVEGAFDSVLRGTDGNMLMQRISGSFKIPVPDALSVAPVDGIDVVTTLDIDVQDVAENALRKQLELGDADWGTAVLMEVSTGEIRAITNLTRKGEGKFVEDFNYAVGMNLEPGSTFKLASLMTLLDDAGASLEEHYDTGDGRMMIGRARVVDSHACGDVTLREVFEHSSNVGFALAVNKYYKENPRRFVDHLYKMGLGMPLDLQIPGGADPVIFRPGDASWSGVTLTMMSYGYALRLTPLKTLSFYNAVANDGKMVRPMFVKELKQYGQTLRTFPPEVMVPSIGSPKVIAQVQEALRGVVNDGTARGLKNPYYSVAVRSRSKNTRVWWRARPEPRRSRWAGTVILTVSAAVTTWPRWWGISRPTSPATVVLSRSRPTTGRAAAAPITAHRWPGRCSVRLPTAFTPATRRGRRRCRSGAIRRTEFRRSKAAGPTRCAAWRAGSTCPIHRNGACSGSALRKPIRPEWNWRPSPGSRPEPCPRWSAWGSKRRSTCSSARGCASRSAARAVSGASPFPRALPCSGARWWCCSWGPGGPRCAPGP